MRIAVITNAYPPNARGGAGQVAASLVELWRESGHEVHVWESYADWLTKGLVDRLFGHLVLDRCAAVFLPVVCAWKPDVVVTHNLTGVGWATGRIMKEKEIRWIHILHDVQLFEPSGQLREDRVTSWQRFWSAWRQMVFGAPNLVVSPTKWLLEAHARRGFHFSQTKMIVNPAPIPRTMHEMGWGKISRAGWLFVGRLSKDKGADLFLELARACPNELFICIGDGPLRSELGLLKNVLCRGSLSREDVQRQMSVSFALLMPSRLQENQPTVIVEALSSELPVIASRNGGIPETLGEAGMIVDLDVESWKAAMKIMREEHEVWRTRAGERSTEFLRDGVKQKWEEILR